MSAGPPDNKARDGKETTMKHESELILNSLASFLKSVRECAAASLDYAQNEQVAEYYRG